MEAQPQRQPEAPAHRPVRPPFVDPPGGWWAWVIGLLRLPRAVKSGADAHHTEDVGAPRLVL